MRILATVLLILTTASTALALGGQDILVTEPVIASSYQARDVIVMTDGTIFALAIGDTFETVLDIHRSVDGGTTWSIWSQIESAVPGGIVGEGELARTSGTSERLLVVWLDEGDGYDLMVSRADPAQENPVWTHVNVDPTSNQFMTNPRVSTNAFSGLTTRVRLVWAEGGEVRYASSTNGGLTWSAPLTLADLNIGFIDCDVHADESGGVHAVWMEYDFVRDQARIDYRRTLAGGATIGDWEPVVEMGWASDRMNRITVAGDPAGDGVVVAAGGNAGNPPLQLFTSSDLGSTWDAVQEYPTLAGPDAAWGSNGPQIAVQIHASTGNGRAILAPDTAISGSWSTELMMDPGYINAFLALDPSRGDAPVMVGLTRVYGEEDFLAMRFDAAWRDAPGYGVPDPFHPYLSIGIALTRPVLPGDLNGDGELELLFSQADSDTAHVLRRLYPSTGYVSGSTLIHPGSEYALLDADGDGDLEPFFFDPTGLLCSSAGLEAELPGYPVDPGVGPAASWISGARVTGQAEDDVVVAGQTTVQVLGPGAVPRPGFPWTAPGAAGAVNGRVALGDVTGDGRIELVVPLTGAVVILDRDGLVVSAFGPGEAAAGSPSLADFDGDGDLEIVIPRADGTIHLVHHDGTTVAPQWPYATGASGPPSQVALAHLAGDARPDLVFMDADRNVTVVTPEGFVPPAWTFGVDPGTALNDPVVGLLGPDGPAIAVGDGDGILHLQNASGPQAQWPRDLAVPMAAALSIGDVDDDGQVELIIPTAESLLVLDMGTSAASIVDGWPISGANVGRTGCIASIPATAVPVTRPQALVLRAPSPNPFNPRTEIAFALRHTADVTLQVFDLRGRMVRELVRGVQPAGEFRASWNGTDRDGRLVASGTYVFRLQGGGEVQARKAVLIK